MREPAYFDGHHLSIPRVGPTMDLIRAEGWMQGHFYHEARPATDAELETYHDTGYLKALAAAEKDQYLSEKQRRQYSLGQVDGVTQNPIFKKMLTRHRTSAGGALQAVALLKKPGRVFHLSGGAHHARPNRANGFCYLQDLVMSLDGLQKELKGDVLYIDLDAHFGDGVHAYAAQASKISTISLHANWLWPKGQGKVSDDNAGKSLNIPVPGALTDAEFSYLVAEVILPRIDQIAPKAIVLQCGVDSLRDDMMGGFQLSNQAYCDAVQKIMTKTDRLLVTGGGGYNPYSVIRGWTGVWATLIEAPRQPLSSAGQNILSGIGDLLAKPMRVKPDWIKTLWDQREAQVPIRQDVLSLAEELTQKFALTPNKSLRKRLQTFFKPSL